MAIETKKGVSATHPDYDKALPKWKRCLDFAAGEDAVHAARTTYLPKLKGEDDEDYSTRLARTPFFNATWRTISGLKGMAFRKAPTVVAPASFQPYRDNIDQAGTSLDLWAQDFFQHILTTGRGAALVDFPSVSNPGSMTRAQADAQGLRPSIQQYKAESITNWRFTRINNETVLEMITLCESVRVGDDEFDNKQEKRWRVLDLVVVDDVVMYRQRLFKREKEQDVQIGGDVYPQMNGRPLSRIPVVLFGVDSSRITIDEPPLIDLVNMNWHHYQVSADYEHGCHFSGLPTPFVWGAQLDENESIYIGSKRANVFTNPDGHAEYLEVTSDFGALRKNLDEKKSEMAVLGARMLESQKTAVESAETLKRRGAGEESQLASMADVFSANMTQALRLLALWAGIPGDVSYQMSSDYGVAGLTAQELTALVSAWQAGAISEQTLFQNLQRGEVVAEGVTFEQEQERIRSGGVTGV